MVDDLTRRRVLALASGLVVATATPAPAHAETALPVTGIEKILGARGDVTGDVLEIDIARDDIDASVRGIRFRPGFQIHHELYFQSIAGGRAICNGDLALREPETQPVIDAFLAADLVVQAFHQHFHDLHPQVWFVHFRGVGDPLDLARRVRGVIDRTATRLPRPAPADPSTPLPAKRIAALLGGDATVGEHGVVSVGVARTHGVRLGGIDVRPGLNVSTNVQLQPLAAGQAVAVADFSMTAGEVQPVLAVMRRLGWDVGCLYNQETDEDPPLYFSHMLKAGEPLVLAREIRAGLDHTAAA